MSEKQADIARLFIRCQQHKDLCWKAFIAKKPQEAQEQAERLAECAAELRALLTPESAG